jgi:hypothetical protein
MAAENVAFRAALARINFDAPAINAIVAQGIDSVLNLTLLPSDGIKLVCKIVREDEVNITLMMQIYLEAFRYWGIDRNRLGLSNDAALFTIASEKNIMIKTTIYAIFVRYFSIFYWINITNTNCYLKSILF